MLPSRAEAFPYAVLEAAGAKLPLITTRVGGIPEIFGPQESTLLPPDDESSVAKAMRAALQDPAKQLSQAETLHQRVAEHFNVNRMVGNICSFYEMVLAPRLEVKISRKSVA